MYLCKKDINELLSSNNLIIRPLLDLEQVGEFTIDFRLGTDFLVSVHGREPLIDTSFQEEADKTAIHSFFQPTRRKIGQEFIFYPNQLVLCSSLEYIKLPENVFATLSMRSSYSRLGLSISTIVHAGYCGCISIELVNVNNNPIKIAIGTRIFQARLFELEEKIDYRLNERKYVAQVRPVLSRISEDKELKILKDIAKL